MEAIASKQLSVCRNASNRRSRNKIAPQSHWKTGFDAGHFYSHRMRVFPKAEPMNSGTARNRKFVGAKVLEDRVNGLGLLFEACLGLSP
jgi:hypothetical protein